MISRVVSAILLLLLTNVSKAEPRLLGSWKSSLHVSLAKNDIEALAPNTRSFIRQTVGLLTITYEAQSLIENSPATTLSIDGKNYEWTAANGRFPYKVLKRGENKVLIKRRLVDGSWVKGVITFESPDLYWVNWQDQSDVEFNEYFVRQ